MTIAIIGAMEQEVAILKSHLENISETKVSEFTFYQGKIGNSDVVLVQSGIGKVASAIATTLVINLFKPNYVINTGSAGGFDPELKVGDIAIGSELVHHDVDVTAFNYEFGQVPGMPATFKSDTQLVEAAQSVIGNMENVTCKTGLVATGDSFMCDPERINETRERFPSMLAVEMEGAAIAQVCHQLNTPFVVIRSLSDIAGQESPMSFEAYLEIASKNSSAMVLDLIAALK
jgi:adenosylhomocysteine nucleosidase